MTAVVALAVGICAFAAALAALAQPRRSWIAQRLEPHVGTLAPEGPARMRVPRGDPLARLLEGTHLLPALARELERAGIAWRPERLFAVTVGAPAGLAVLSLASGGSGGTVLLLVLAAALVPHLFLRIAARRRARAFDAQLPDVLDMLAGALRVGHAFDQALRAVAEDADEPTGSELRRALGEIRLGRSTSDALGGVGERLASDDLPFVLTAIAIQQEVGGSLADLLGIVATTVRERQQFRLRLKALTGLGRASALTLIVLPFVVAGGLSLISRDYMAPLWHTSTGHLLVAVVLAMMAVGAGLLKKIVSIEG